MRTGSGPYDDEVARLMIATHADGVLLIIFGGDKGTRFCAELPEHILKGVPGILRNAADEVERQLPPDGQPK